MTSSSQRLANVPCPQLFEATSCWLTRLALSQGADLAELLRFLKIPGNTDVDRALLGPHLGDVKRVCGLPSSAFQVQERLMHSLNSISPIGDKFLLTDRLRRPKFRYCPVCIKSMRVPHFPIHWRFGAWRWCPEHDCLLESNCRSCGRPIIFPTDIFSSKAGMQGCLLINHCLGCGARLSGEKPCYLQIGNLRRVSWYEEMVLANGRALLSALYHGYFFTSATGIEDLNGLKRIETYGLLPSGEHWMSVENVRNRIIPDSAETPVRWRSKPDY